MRGGMTGLFKPGKGGFDTMLKFVKKNIKFENNNGSKRENTKIDK